MVECQKFKFEKWFYILFIYCILLYILTDNTLINHTIVLYLKLGKFICAKLCIFLNSACMRILLHAYIFYSCNLTTSLVRNLKLIYKIVILSWSYVLRLDALNRELKRQRSDRIVNWLHKRIICPSTWNRETISSILISTFRNSEFLLSSAIPQITTRYPDNIICNEI